MRTTSLCVLAAMAIAAGAAGGCGHAASARPAGNEPRPDASTAEHAAYDDATLQIEEFIQRKVPGVLIRRTGSEITVQVRGVGTLGSGTNALVVIDGVPQESPNALLNLSPTAIERVQVLKDAAAGQYGVRGAMGVLVITTKRGT